MVSLSHIEEQLKKVGCNFRFWGRPEIRELCKILMPNEVIAQAVNGRYKNGFAMLCVTDHRLLLIDKKPMFLTLEDIRFDMIAEIDYSSQLLDGTVRIITPNRELVFISWNQGRLRNILNYTQQRVSEIRHHFIQQQFQPQQQASRPQFIDSYAIDYAAPAVGELALQGNARSSSAPVVPLNPYTKVPLTMRHRRFPKFY